jgi:hypothetical protein
MVEYTSFQSAELEMIFSTPKTLLEANIAPIRTKTNIIAPFTPIPLFILLMLIPNHPLYSSVLNYYINVTQKS